MVVLSGNRELLAGRYELGDELGAGGMGRVYRAHDSRLRRDVAVKIIDGVDQTRLATEARSAAGLNHPGIASIFDVGVDQGRAFIVMELVTGPSLHELLQKRGTLPPGEAAALAAQVADALDAAHRHGIIHCDVKPRNIVLSPGGRAKLIDFGIARAEQATRPAADQVIHGSAFYLAPEQVRGERVDGRADTYALGAVLYEMLTGRTPFTGATTAAVVTQRLVMDPAPPSTLNGAVPLVLDAMVLQALAREPGARYSSAGAFGNALNSLAGTLGSPDDVTRRIPAVVAAAGALGAATMAARGAATHGSPLRRFLPLAGLAAIAAVGLWLVMGSGSSTEAGARTSATPSLAPLGQTVPPAATATPTRVPPATPARPPTPPPVAPAVRVPPTATAVPQPVKRKQQPVRAVERRGHDDEGDGDGDD